MFDIIFYIFFFNSSIAWQIYSGQYFLQRYSFFLILFISHFLARHTPSAIEFFLISGYNIVVGKCVFLQCHFSNPVQRTSQVLKV